MCKGVSEQVSIFIFIEDNGIVKILMITILQIGKQFK